MTKAIEDELNLPRLEDALKEAAGESGEVVDSSVEQMANALQNVDPSKMIDSDPSGVYEHEDETNEIYDLAMKAHKDLLDLGYNIEPKNAGANAFMPSAKFLEIALKASQSKTDRKMEQIKMVMEQDRHKKEMGETVEDAEAFDKTPSIVANRNDIMEKIRKGEI